MSAQHYLEQKYEPLFPEVIWSRPETKRGAGKLLIIGGSAGAMSGLAADHAAAEAAGIGTTHLLVPDSLEKVTRHIPFINYAPSTPSGSFSARALSEALAPSQHVDAVLLSGDMGKNSETALMLEKFVTHYSGLLAVAPASLESFAAGSSTSLAARPDTILFLDFKQLQQLGTALSLEEAFTSTMTMLRFAHLLHELSASCQAHIVVEKDNQTWVATSSQLAVCHHAMSPATSTVWLLQQPTKPFQTLVSSLL